MLEDLEPSDDMYDEDVLEHMIETLYMFKIIDFHTYLNNGGFNIMQQWGLKEFDDAGTE